MKRNYLWQWMLIWLVCALSATANSEAIRIVSLAPSNTAIVRDLGLGEFLLGITKYCVLPKNASKAVVTGTITHPNIEFITTLKPTLVLGNVESNRVETLDKIESVGLPLVRLGPSQSLEDIIRDVEKVAEITNRSASAKSLIKRVTNHLRNIQRLVKDQGRKRVFVEVWHQPLTTVSRLGFIHHVVDMAGGNNIFADALIAYPKTSMESVIAQKPDAIFILTHSLFDDDRVYKYREYPQLQDAIVHQTDASELSQPSLTAFVNAVEYFAAILHPTVEIPTMPPLQDLLP